MALRGPGGRWVAAQRGDAAEAAAAGAGGVARGVGAVLGVERVHRARGPGCVPAPAGAAGVCRVVLSSGLADSAAPILSIS